MNGTNLVDEQFLLNQLQKMRFSFDTDSALAFALGVSSQYLSNVLAKKRPINEKLALGLGFYPVKMYAMQGSEK
jgi:hypothetical protein